MPELQVGRVAAGWGSAAAVFLEFNPFPLLLLEVRVLG